MFFFMVNSYVNYCIYIEWNVVICMCIRVKYLWKDMMKILSIFSKLKEER